MTTPVLPPKPLPPEGYDCCGGGCADCELRLYVERLKAWKRVVTAFEAAQDTSDVAAATPAAPAPKAG